MTPGFSASTRYLTSARGDMIGSSVGRKIVRAILSSIIGGRKR